MSEHDPTDPFDEIVSFLESDDTYRASISRVRADFDQAERANVAAEHPGLFDLSRPYATTSIDEVGQAIHDEYRRLCDLYGADINNFEQTPLAFSRVQDGVATFVNQLESDLCSSDMLATTRTLVVDMGRDDDETMSVLGLGEGETLTGTFVHPIICSMPNDMSPFSLDESCDPPMGIGLMLQHPSVVDETGERHTDIFRGDEVIVALGTMGLTLHKITYQDDQER